MASLPIIRLFAWSPLWTAFVCATTFAASDRTAPTGVAAPFGPGGTWNVYRVVDVAATFPEAVKRAAAEPEPTGTAGVKGHLATISSAAENMFVKQLVDGDDTWIALTDSTDFGASPGGHSTTKGWAWITGEPLTFTAWRPAQPDDWHGEGLGEDAVAIGPGGLWSDGGIALRSQKDTRHRYVIEWETNSPKPPRGTVPLRPVLDEALPWPALVEDKWNVALFRLDATPWSLRQALEMAKLERPAETIPLDELIVSFESGSSRPRTFVHKTDTLPGLGRDNAGVSLARTTLRLEKPTTLSVLVHANDGFACRIPGAQWTNASGDGVIDPLDPWTFTVSIARPTGRGAATAELPAGVHEVQVAHFNSRQTASVEVLAAEGSHRSDDDFAGWQPIGRTSAESPPLPRLGPPGWAVAVSKPGQRGTESVEATATTLEGEARVQPAGNFPVLHFADPDSSAPTAWSGAQPFPNDTPDLPMNWGLRALATLVIPENGRYIFGALAHGGASIRIKGVLPEGLTHADGDKARIVGERLVADEFDYENMGLPVAAVYSLNKGTYPLEVYYRQGGGAAWLTVFAGREGGAASLLRP